MAFSLLYCLYGTNIITQPKFIFLFVFFLEWMGLIGNLEDNFVSRLDFIIFFFSVDLKKNNLVYSAVLEKYYFFLLYIEFHLPVSSSNLIQRAEPRSF